METKKFLIAESLLICDLFDSVPGNATFAQKNSPLLYKELSYAIT
jgi:hypothetical protein